MATLILSDIHGNLPALRAILSTPEAQGCNEIISLGDHVNFGPESRAVHELLASLGAVMLLGNHEERLLRAGEAEFAGYNWALMHWTARQMQGIPLDLPTDLHRGAVHFTHGVPGDPWRLVSPPELPALLETLPPDTQLLLSGHNHLRWDVTANGRRAFNPGSAGMNEDGPGSTAPFAILDGSRLIRCEAAYDVRDVIRACIDTGASRAAPMMCRACIRVMQTAEYQGIVKLIRHVAAVGAPLGLTVADEAAWQAADRIYPWAEPVSTEEYWRLTERV